MPEPDAPVAPFVNGEFRRSSADQTTDVINPSTGRLAFKIPAGSPDDVNAAVSAARRAFDEGHWSTAAPSFRKRVLRAFADLVARDAAALDALDAVEMGKPVREPLFNAAAASGLLRFYAEAIDKLPGQLLASDRHSFVGQRLTPRGVVAAIVPWNFPAYNAILKVAPALAAGNCVVLKPSELSSRSALQLAILAGEAGLPPGVLNVTPGLGQTVGQALGRHPDVDMMAFTGSTAVGKRMLEYAGQSNMKLVMCECGGKSPHVVFADGVELDAAAQMIAGMMLANQGQICSAGSRVLVDRSIEADLLERIAERMGRVVIGDASDPETSFGPLASASQCERVMRYIEAAPGEGAELVTGGRRIRQDSGGYFVEPTLFRKVTPSARLAQEEVFGPVLSVTAFDSEAKAIEFANATVYGLAAYLWTADLTTALRVSKAIRSSVVVNACAPLGEGAGYATSFEPAGQSGLGVEGGLAGMESYLRRQLVWINHG